MRTEKIQNYENLNYEKAYIFKVDAHSSEYIEVGDFLSIGRDPKHRLCLDDVFISTNHARIERNHAGLFVLRDLQSQNGVFLNNTRVKEAVLQANDSIQLGQNKFQFRITKIEEADTYLFSKNKSWQTQLNTLAQIAKTNCPALISGPSGTGKERLAHLIHEMSSRALGPFIGINCGALNPSLIESELFGHIKGSFTGSQNTRKGSFESARGGTLFLDEIGDLPLNLQPKLLRAIENQEIKPVGSDEIVKTDVRIVAATHHDLKKQIINKEFRQDLYYRLNTITISPPSLMQRSEDFETLIYHFCRKLKVRFSFGSIKKLKSYSWPGNIRELRNTVEKAAIIFGNQKIEESDLSILIDPLETKNIFSEKQREALPVKGSARRSLMEIERAMICRELVNHRGKQSAASESLGIPKSTLNDKIKKYKIDIQDILNKGWTP